METMVALICTMCGFVWFITLLKLYIVVMLYFGSVLVDLESAGILEAVKIMNLRFKTNWILN